MRSEQEIKDLLARCKEVSNHWVIEPEDCPVEDGVCVECPLPEILEWVLGEREKVY